MSAPPDRPTSARTVGILGRGPSIDALTPLQKAYADQGHHVITVARDAFPATSEELDDLAHDLDALLAIYPRVRSPRTVAAGPTATARDSRKVPIGLLPDVGPEALGRFAVAAARAHRRRHSGAPGSVALLAQRSPRYRSLASRIRRLLAERTDRTPVWWWTADELVRDDLLIGLRCGVGAALYVGHARPIGWVGYRGIRAHHLDGVAEPVGAILSLACLTASRRRTGLSFAEALPLQGAAASTLGAVTTTSHAGNARWAVRIVHALAAGLDTIGDVVAAAEPYDDPDRPYRILGDPLAPLLDAPGAYETAHGVTQRSSLMVAV